MGAELKKSLGWQVGGRGTGGWRGRWGEPVKAHVEPLHVARRAVVVAPTRDLERRGGGKENSEWGNELRALLE